VIDHHRARILSMLAERPRNIKAFTDGEVTLQVSARHVLNWLADMADEGLVIHTKADEYRITEAGRAKLREKPSVAGLRELAIEATPWRPQPWVPARIGAEDHKRCRSLGIDGNSSISTTEES
jgi:predicted transcriptional regulator